MLETVKELDKNVRTGGYEMLILVAFWWFVLVTSTGLSITLSWPAMKIFYPALFKVLFG